MTVKNVSVDDAGEVECRAYNKAGNASIRSNLQLQSGLGGLTKRNIRDNKVHGANMGPICGRQDPDGPHVGHMNSEKTFIKADNSLTLISK